MSDLHIIKQDIEDVLAILDILRRRRLSSKIETTDHPVFKVRRNRRRSRIEDAPERVEHPIFTVRKTRAKRKPGRPKGS